MENLNLKKNWSNERIVKHPFSCPENYFEVLKDKIHQKIKFNSPLYYSQELPFTVPINYFKKLKHKILELTILKPNILKNRIELPQYLDIPENYFENSYQEILNKTVRKQNQKTGLTVPQIILRKQLVYICLIFIAVSFIAIVLFTKNIHIKPNKSISLSENEINDFLINNADDIDLHEISNEIELEEIDFILFNDTNLQNEDVNFKNR